MDKLTSKKALLDSIRLSEAATFECDEKAILNAYANQGENKSSLAIKILSVFGGFLASLAFLGFLFIAELYDSELALSLSGLGFIIAAIWLNKVYDKLIIDTFSVSIYILGFALLSLGLSEMNLDENLNAVVIMLIALSSLMVTQNFIFSFISVLTVSCSFLFLTLSTQFFDLIHLYVALYTLLLTYVVLNEAKIISLNKIASRLYDPLRIGLLVSLLLGLIVLGQRYIMPVPQNHIWLSSIITSLVTLYLVHIILKINEINSLKNKVMIFTLSACILMATLFAPAISGAIVIILLSFLVNYKTGLAIGIVSILYFISQYYYDMNFTLLTKSILLFVSGILFLLLYVFTTKNLRTNEKL